MPFYRAAYRCVHTTTWLQPFYILTLNILDLDEKGKPGPVSWSESKVLSLSQFRSQAFKDLQSRVRIQSPSQDDVKQAWGVPELRQKPDLYLLSESALPTSEEATLSANLVAPERYIDTHTTYYFNQKKPFSGSANGTIALNEEGIATSVNAQTEDTTFSSIMSTLSVSDLITSAAGLAIALVGGPKPKYAFELQITTRVVQHIDSQPQNGSVPPCNPVAADDYVKGNMNVQIVDADQAPKPKADDKTSKPGAGNK